MGQIIASPKVTQISGETPEEAFKEQMRYVEIFLDNARQQINGNLELIENLRGVVKEISFSAPNVDQSVTHLLGFSPLGYLTIKKSANFNIYDGTGVTNSSVISLKSSAAGTATIFIF